MEENSGAESAGGADIDVDSILAAAEAPSEGIPMSADDAKAKLSGQEPKEQAKTANELFYEFQVNGKPVKIAANDPKLTQWLSQGYAYPQKMAEVNKQIEEMRAKEAKIQEMEKRFGPIDEYVRQNPDFWQLVEQQWQQRGQAYDPNNPLARELMGLKQQLGELTEFQKQVLSERQAQQQQHEDKALETEIDSIRKQHPDLDLSAVQPDGHTLEYHVLKYANDRGIRNFTDAFLAFNHKHFVTKAAERAKETAAKETQKKTKLGLLSKSSTPRGEISTLKDAKAKTHNDILEEIKGELGIA